MLPDDSHEAENVWKAQDQEKQPLPMNVSPERLAGMVRSREKLNAVLRWAAVAVTGALAAAFLYNVWSTDQPWIRLGQAWAFGWLAYMGGTEFLRGTQRKGVDEPCVRFLERQHKQRASGYLRMRRRLWLLIPSIVASWVGRGPLGPAPFIGVGVCLVLVWLAFGRAAAKATTDIDELQRSVGTE